MNEALRDDDSDNDDDNTSHSAEPNDLPFAMTTATESPEAQQQHHVLHASTKSMFGTDSRLSTSHNSHEPPALAASVISSRTDGESAASHLSQSQQLDSSSFLQTDSRYLDAAASLLSPAFSLMGGSSVPHHIPSDRRDAQGNTQQQQPPYNVYTSSNTPAPTLQDQSVAFSQLMNEADNRQETNGTRLPVLPEEASVASADSILASSFLQPSLPSSYHHREETGRRQPQTAPPRTIDHFAMRDSILAASQATIVAEGGTAGQPSVSPLLSTLSQHRSQERRLASLAGAVAQRTGDRTFYVSVDIPTITVRDVMDVVGNPDLLRLWCDPVRTLVITKSSEGARNAANLRGPEETGREYEGEWIEATTSQLEHPSAASCVYGTGQAMASVFGFPTYGKVGMFVERQRGQVGLTIGPFVGSIEVCHRLRVQPIENGTKVRIMDEVRLRREGEEPTQEDSFCGLFGIVERCLLPTTEDYMDQVLSSMARLRFLIENGETSVRAPTFEQEQENIRTQLEEDSLATPLLRA